MQAPLLSMTTNQGSYSSKRTPTQTVVHVDCEDGNNHGSPLSGSNTEPSTPSVHSANQYSTASGESSSKLTLEEKVLDRDTAVVTTYVKEDMYYGVKFLYDPRKDLAIGGAIFNHFRKLCKEKLEGLKKYQNKREKDLYLRYLWKHALDARVQQEALAVKRSSVYTVMQNKFFCKCTCDIVSSCLLWLASTHYFLYLQIYVNFVKRIIVTC